MCIRDSFVGLKKIDKEFLFKGLEDEKDKLMSIRKYYSNLETELQKDEYRNTGIDTEKIFMNIKLIFELCQFWNEVEDVINSKQDKEIVEFEKYYELNGYSVKGSRCV